MNKDIDYEVFELIKKHLVYEKIELEKDLIFANLYKTANSVISFLKENNSELLSQKDRLIDGMKNIAIDEFKRFSMEDIYLLCSVDEFQKILEYVDKRELFKNMRSHLDEHYEEWKLYNYIKIKSIFNYNTDNNEFFDFYKKEIATILESSDVKRILKRRRKDVFCELIVKCLEENLIDTHYMGNDKKSVLSLLPIGFSNKSLLLKLKEEGFNTNLNENNLVVELFVEGNIDLLCALIEISDYSYKETLIIKNDFIEYYKKNPDLKNALSFLGYGDPEKNFNVFTHALDIKLLSIEKKEMEGRIHSQNKISCVKRI